MMMKRMILVFGVMVAMMGKGFGDGAYSITASQVLITTNTIFSGINIYQITQTKTYDNIIPTFGICSGAIQILLSTTMLSRPLNDIATNYMMYRNIDFVIGTFTIVTSIWNLSKDKKPQDTRTSWNLYSFPARDKSMGMGLSYTLRF